jgi:hypothetical protein
VRGRFSDLVKRIEVAADRRTAIAGPSHDRLVATIAVLHEDHVVPTDVSAEPDRLGGLADVFGLDELDADLLLVAAAPDFDANLALVFGLLRGGDGPARATVGVALELCGLPTASSDGFARLGPAAVLCRHALLEVSGQLPWLNRELTVPDRVLAHLAGADDVEPMLRSAIVPAVPLVVPAADVLARGIAANVPLVWVRAAQGTSGLALAAGAFASVGLGQLAVDLSRCAGEVALTEVLRSAAREACLRGLGLIVVAAERLPEAGMTQALGLLEDTPVPVVLIGSRAWDPTWLARYPLTMEAPILNPAERASAWEAVAGPEAPADGLAGLRLTPEAMAQTAQYATVLSRAQDQPITADLVLQAARVVGSSGTAGRRPTVGFDALVLPDYADRALHRLVSWARHRDEVVQRSSLFNADRKGSGITALFSGSPGTGKTLAANVIAAELGLDLFQVNLSEIIDKYIGETEKNLERVFHEAESLNVVLFFDEADALFGRRSEVKDAHDRYANQEVAYLLQRIERFDGITILATNLRGNLDQAFSRRMHFIIYFPDPDVPTRRRIWELYLSRLGALDPDDPIDLDHLAATLEMAGGDIRNVVLASLYDSIAAGEPLGMRHILASTVREYQKLGRRVPAHGFQPAD